MRRMAVCPFLRGMRGTKFPVLARGYGEGGYGVIDDAGVKAGERAEKTERAARQQGSSSLRENSSNGGKAIRTFWLHSRFRYPGCQGLF